jgi:acetylornithine aminotransferase
MGNNLMRQLNDIPQLENVRGRGLMIGFDVPEKIKDLKKRLLANQQIFTGEAKPNVIRLLPSLALSQKDADSFIEAINEEITAYENTPTTVKA